MGVELVVNAFVLASTASPLDRYQIRVIWIVPLVAMAAAASARRSARSLDQHEHQDQT